jgi:hypothetical protein
VGCFFLGLMYYLPVVAAGARGSPGSGYVIAMQPETEESDAILAFKKFYSFFS